MSAGLARRCLAEAIGTALLVGIGTGAIVASASFGGVPQWIIAVAWFLAVAVPVLLFAAVSGAHLNPAVTLGLVAANRFPARELPLYVVAQLVGALAGSLAVLLLLGDANHLGATLPRGGDVLLVFPLEGLFTLALVVSVLWLARLPRGATRLWLLLPAAVVGVSTQLIGPLTGSSLNPARSLAPAALSGAVSGLWAYLIVVPLTALGVGLLEGRILAPRVPGSGPVRPERAERVPASPGPTSEQ